MQLDELLAELGVGLPPRVPPDDVARYLRATGLRVDQVRWCDWCRVVAPAVDRHQVSLLDALGFDSLCPECKCPGP